jgi:hypothetical protein
MTLDFPPNDPSDKHYVSQRKLSRRKAKRPQIPTEDEILHMILQLNSMVMLNLASPAKANVMQRNLKIVLDALTQRSEAGNQRELPLDALAEALRLDPSVIQLPEGFLSDEQIEWLLRQDPDV